MAMKILAECINCGACEPECPNHAITADVAIYVVDVDRCTECVGAYASPQCVEVCGLYRPRPRSCREPGGLEGQVRTPARVAGRRGVFHFTAASASPSTFPAPARRPAPCASRRSHRRRLHATAPGTAYRRDSRSRDPDRSPVHP
jgi:hypothetical protein